MKIFRSKIFHGCKIISSKTGPYQKFSKKFWSIIVMVEKLFPRKQVPTKNVQQIFLRLKFIYLMFAKTFPRKQFPTKQFHENIVVENFLWLQNHFLENMFQPKFSSNFFGRKFFMVAKSFPRKQVPTKSFIKFFWSKIFYVRKIISSKTGSY